MKAGLRKRDELEHRMVAARLDREEGQQQRRRAGQRGDDRRAPPALRVAADQAEDQQEEAAREGRQPRQVDPLRVLGGDVGEAQLGQHDGDDPDRDVDEEDPFPAEVLGDQAADQRADRDGAADRRSPDAERGGAVAAVELLPEQGERGGEHRRAADPLQPARQVEQGRVAGDAAEEGGEGEEAEPEREDAAAAQAVAERAGGEQEGGEHQRVGVDDPLQAGEARAEVPLDVGQGDVDDRDVQQQHERRDRAEDEGPPFALHRRKP